jgi:hypothetical protein
VPGDRYELEVYPIPVVALTRQRTHKSHLAERTSTAETFGATLYSYAEEDETWAFLGNDSQQLEISIESARRLQRGLRGLLSFYDAQVALTSKESATETSQATELG